MVLLSNVAASSDTKSLQGFPSITGILEILAGPPLTHDVVRISEVAAWAETRIMTNTNQRASGNESTTNCSTLRRKQTGVVAIGGRVDTQSFVQDGYEALEVSQSGKSDLIDAT